jgi:tellurite resistance protein
VAGTTKRSPRRHGRFTIDQALIAVMIASMEANAHTSPEEAQRAHHMIWSMRRFRHRDGEDVDELIDTVRERMEQSGIDAVLEQAVGMLPARLRQSAFAVATDLLLADAVLQRSERRFLLELARDLGLPPKLAQDVLRVMLIKNDV